MKIKRIGVIGGGQLAWMMGQEADQLGVQLFVQTPNPNDPAVSVAAGVVLGEIEDVRATTQLAQQCDVITFENEFIDLQGLKALQDQGICFRPSLAALSPLLDKYDQRCYLQEIGLPVPPFCRFESFSPEELNNLTFPLVLKARRHGYDGQGTFIVKNKAELAKIIDKIPVSSLMWEAFIPYQKELAVMVARSAQGETRVYPVVETYQKNQVCHWVITPVALPDSIIEEINRIAIDLVTQLEVIGIFGIEFFLNADNQVLVNEIAPRTHNSGHYTLDGCYTSQFAMQLQAVGDLPLGNPSLRTKGAVMVNLLGLEDKQTDYEEKKAQLSQINHAHLHWYGKQEARQGRKLGHITILVPDFLPSRQQLEEIATQVETIWYR
ncbi:MAG: 5-(carboxyamino)imidazole ribonucleotide synthase [Microcystaceae cyanobacterium]